MLRSLYGYADALSLIGEVHLALSKSKKKNLQIPAVFLNGKVLMEFWYKHKYSHKTEAR